MAGQYDVSIDSIDLVSFEGGFTETIGSEYELVGAAVMPGPPRPLGFYNMTIGLYGDSGETDPFSVGDGLRDSVRSFLQNDTVRTQGVDFSTTFDTSINGVIVIGTADIAYGAGGPTFADYLLQINNAAHIGATQTLLQVHQLAVNDRRSVGAPLDLARKVYRQQAISSKSKLPVRHYLPVGAFDVVGQVNPVLPETTRYGTIFGDGVMVDDRFHMESLRFDQSFADRRKGRVRIFDRRTKVEPEYSASGDRSPKEYGWAQVFGPRFPFTVGDVPVIDNGCCRVRFVDGSTFVVDTVEGDGYELATTHFSLGYSGLLSAGVKEWNRERAVVAASFSGSSGRADVYITLQRGWSGPQVDIYSQGHRRGKLSTDKAHPVEEDSGWRRVHILGDERQTLVDVHPSPYFATRY